jgi:membrane protein
MTSRDSVEDSTLSKGTAGDARIDPGSMKDHLRQRAHRAKGRLQESSGGDLWKRLNSMDFMNRGLIFASVLLLCFFPFLIVATSLTGRSASTTVVRDLGLNHEAAADVGRVFASPHATSGQLSGLSYVLFIVGGIAAATAVQDLYEAAFDLKSRGFKDTWRRALWLALVFGGGFFVAWLGKPVRNLGGPALLAGLAFPYFAAFWWFTMWFLLGGRVSWRALFPSAIATGVCWVGMEVVFSLVYSNSVIHDYKKYGDIGVIIAMMSYFIAIAVVIILGAVAGQVWRDRRGKSKRAGPVSQTTAQDEYDSIGGSSAGTPPFTRGQAT